MMRTEKIREFIKQNYQEIAEIRVLSIVWKDILKNKEREQGQKKHFPRIKIPDFTIKQQYKHHQ